MNRRPFSNKYSLPIIIAIVIVISWVGVLDEYSDNYTDDSIIEAGVTYLIARGINGIVSVLQTTTVHAGLGLSGSMQFGQILDPINDLIERFSHVMSLAIGSLALQKILLGISAHGVFKLLIVGVGITLIVAYITKYRSALSLLSRCFFILIFIRFSLVIVVLLNSFVDNIFISNQISDGTQELGEFQADIVQLKNNSGNLDIDRSIYEESIRDDQFKIDEINTQLIPNFKQELADTNSQLIQAKAILKEIERDIAWYESLNPFYENTKASEAELRISILEQKIDTLERNIEEQEELINILTKDIEESEKRISGEPVGIYEIVNDNLPSISGLKRNLSLDIIQENITEAANNIFHLSALFLLKTILIPIAFFFLFIWGVKGIWKSDLSNIFSTQENLTK